MARASQKKLLLAHLDDDDDDIYFMYLILAQGQYLLIWPKGECLCGVVANVLDCNIVVRKFELLLFYVYFHTDALKKSMEPFILPAMG